jgi:hypothetical protein
MKKFLQIITIFAVSLPLMFTSCFVSYAKDIKGDGNLITQSIPISKFSKVEIETKVEINYSQGKDTEKLEFTVDKNLLEYYDIFSKGDVLYIKLKEEYKNKISPNPTKSLITVSSEHLEEIEIAGSSIFNFCSAFTSKKLSIDLAGSCKVFAKKFPVTIEDCDIDMAGSCQVHLSGTIQTAEIDLAGSGSVKALDCEIEKLSVDIAGSGSVEAFVTKKLDVEIAGSGIVSFKGDPKVTSDIAGSGKVKKL